MFDTLVDNKVVGFFSSVKSSTAFKISYLLLAFLSFNSITANLPIVSYAAYLVVAFGFLVLVSRVICYNRYWGMPLFKLLLLFLASFVISALFSIRYGIMENVQGFIWLTLQFCCLYLYDKNTPLEALKKDLSLFALVFVVYTLVASAIGLHMGFAQWQDGFEVDFMKRNILGMFQGRLFGLYSDPNYGAVYAIISILFSWWLWLVKRRKGYLALAIVNALIQFTFLSLTGSRTGVYGAMALVFVLGFLLFVRFFKEGRIKIGRPCIRTVSSVLLSGLLALGVYGGVKVVEQVYLKVSPVVQEKLPFPLERNFLAKRVDIYESPATIEQKENPSKKTITYGIGEDKIGLGARVDVKGDDVSNGRLSIWRSGLEVFKLSPLVGVSHRHILDFATENLPDSFIVQEGFSTMHNVFVDVLAAQGLLGCISILVFIVLAVKRLGRGLMDEQGSDYYQVSFLVGILFAIAFSALFYSEILYINTVGSVVFWVILGYLITRFNRGASEIQGCLNADTKCSSPNKTRNRSLRRSLDA